MKTYFRLEKILVLIGMAVSLLLAYLFQIPCGFRMLFGIPCPTCGMTRAYIALLHADIPTAFDCHSLFWAVPILFLYFLFDGHLFPKKTLNLTVFFTVLSLFLIRWIGILIP